LPSGSNKRTFPHYFLATGRFAHNNYLNLIGAKAFNSGTILQAALLA
jgi:hypothetical protein